MRSKSVPQLSSIELIFEHGTDLMRPRQLVPERLAAVTPTLPTWAAPPVMLQPLSATSRVMKIGIVVGPSISDRPVDDRLLDDPAAAAACPGVANVAIWGERSEMLRCRSIRSGC